MLKQKKSFNFRTVYFHQILLFLENVKYKKIFK